MIREMALRVNGYWWIANTTNFEYTHIRRNLGYELEDECVFIYKYQARFNGRVSYEN